MQNGDTPHLKASHLLRHIDHGLKDGSITVQDFVSLLGDRSFALTILVFSLPNSLPVPGIPGFSTITGIPILVIALQMVFGRENIWLPRKVAEKEIAQGALSRIIDIAIPYVARLEKLLHPRLPFFCTAWGERLVGLLIVTMALILSLPIVGGNFFPGMSISLMALAILERDGLFAIFSMGFCIASIILMYSLLEWAVLALLGWLGLYSQ